MCAGSHPEAWKSSRCLDGSLIARYSFSLKLENCAQERTDPSLTPLSENLGNSVSIKVQVRSNESLEAALRRFKRQCNFGGVFRMAKANTWHEKRSDKRRREGRERIRTILRAARKEDPNFRKSRARR